MNNILFIYLFIYIFFCYIVRKSPLYYFWLFILIFDFSNVISGFDSQSIVQSNILEEVPSTPVHRSAPEQEKDVNWMAQFLVSCTLFSVIYSTLLYCTLLHSTLLYSTLLCSTLLYSTLLYSTLLYSTLL